MSIEGLFPGNKFRFVNIFILEDLQLGMPLIIQKWTERRINLPGARYTMSAVTIPPLIMQKDGKMASGIMVSLYKAAARNFNFTFDSTQEHEGTGRKLANGSWVGSLADLRKGRFDMAAVIRMSFQRHGLIDITNYLWNDQPVFITGLPKAVVPLGALIRPFLPLVWLLFLSSFLSIVPILYWSLRQGALKSVQSGSKDHSGYKFIVVGSKWKYLNKSIMMPLAICLDQDVRDEKRIRLLIGMWMTMMMVLGIGYKDKLFAFLTFPEEEAVPRNLVQLHENKGYHVILYYWKSALFNMLNTSEHEIHRSLVQRLELLPNNVECVLNALLRPKTACIAVKSLLAITMASNATLNFGFTAGVFSETILPMDPMVIAIGLPRNSIWTESWNMVSAMFRDTGLFAKWELDSFDNFRRRGRTWLASQGNDTVKHTMEELIYKYNTPVKALEIQNFLVLFILVALAAFACCILFWFETSGNFLFKSERKGGIGGNGRKFPGIKISQIFPIINFGPGNSGILAAFDTKT
ncbi:unnamed protein product [Allacma fusca]|nr:unnamed protein product [Allacma fusca]